MWWWPVVYTILLHRYKNTENVRNTNHPDQNQDNRNVYLAFPKLWLSRQGQCFNAQVWKAATYHQLIEPQTKGLPYIYWCVFSYFSCYSASVLTVCLCWLPTTPPTTSSKSEKMKVSLIVLFNQLSMVSIVTGMFLTRKCSFFPPFLFCQQTWAKKLRRSIHVKVKWLEILYNTGVTQCLLKANLQHIQW